MRSDVDDRAGLSAVPCTCQWTVPVITYRIRARARTLLMTLCFVFCFVLCRSFRFFVYLPPGAKETEKAGGSPVGWFACLIILYSAGGARECRICCLCVCSFAPPFESFLPVDFNLDMFIIIVRL